jgi:hypothetical protein
MKDYLAEARTLTEIFLPGVAITEIAENCLSMPKPSDYSDVSGWPERPVKIHAWNALAFAMSQISPGQFWPRDHGITWVCGRQVTYWLASDRVDSVLSARATAAELGAEPSGWSLGSVARTVLEWVDCPQKGGGGIVPLLSQSRSVGYYDCKPGWYPSATLIDVQSCYFALWERLPSLRVSYHNAGLQWHKMSEEERGRHRDACVCVAPNKLLRNAVVGAAVGGATGKEYKCWSGGRKLTMGLGEGSNAAAAALVVRTGYELCYRAAVESDSVMSSVDCILTERIPPAVSSWSRVGLRSRIVANGESDVIRCGVYRCGQKYTQPYRIGDRMRAEFPRDKFAGPFLVDLWAA